MTHASRTTPLCLPLLVLTLVACGSDGQRPSDDGVDFGGPQTCTPGEQRTCPCPGGQPDGVQRCDDAGDRYGSCMGCDDEPGTSTAPSPPETSTTNAGEDDGQDEDEGGDGDGDSTGAETPPDVPDADDGIPDNPPQAVPPQPPPDGSDVVDAVAAEHPDLLLGSCVDTGGNNEFIFEVVRRLRMEDDRWGLNWKRGVVGDLSQDVIDYHYGDGVSEESTEVYIIDIIGGHCGGDPQPAWFDVTQATEDAGTVGKWTLADQDL